MLRAAHVANRALPLNEIVLAGSDVDRAAVQLLARDQSARSTIRQENPSGGQHRLIADVLRIESAGGGVVVELASRIECQTDRSARRGRCASDIHARGRRQTDTATW